MNLRRKKIKKRHSIYSESFKELIIDSIFIHNNVSNIDFIAGVIIGRKSLHGTLYFNNNRTSFEDVSNPLLFVKDNIIDMLHLSTARNSVDIYASEYSRHWICKNLISIELKNGKILTIEF